mmetsp:Transcript_12469/g.41063  ORF Transcript_12469/g.41063 Transcript_12469/m.41063 type:complete len:276 (-) Transcript_12469:962-1789(-)
MLSALSRTSQKASTSFRRAYSDFTRLSETVSFGRLAQGDLYILGTAHVSKPSAEEARELIRRVRPDNVFVELCDDRAKKLRAGMSHSSFWGELFGTLNKKGGSFVGNAVELAPKAQYHLLRLIGIEPGAEFMAAMEAADELGARVVHGDQDQRVTLRRIRAAAEPHLKDWRSVWQFMEKLASAPVPREVAEVLKPGERDGTPTGFSANIEAMKRRSVVRALRESNAALLPEISEVLVDERDDFMAERLKDLHGTTVAVVGMAHMDGLERRLSQGA